MDPTQNPAILLLAAVLPMLIAFVKQAGLGTQVNALIALVIYVVVGVLGALLTGGAPTLETLIPWITTVTVIGTVAYNLFWSNLGKSSSDEPSVEQKLVDATSFIK